MAMDTSKQPGIFIEWYVNIKLFSLGTEDCDLCWATRLIIFHMLVGIAIGSIFL